MQIETKKPSKLLSLRKQFQHSKNEKYSHLLNYDKTDTSKRSISFKRKADELDEQTKNKQKIFRRNAEVPLLIATHKLKELTPRQYLKQLGIETKQDCRKWLKLFHPDKGGNSDECAKVLGYVKNVFQ